jgi:hypothetical protein
MRETTQHVQVPVSLASLHHESGVQKMKRIVFVCTAFLVLLAYSAQAESEPSFRISAGPIMMYDQSNQKSGVGGHVTAGYRVTPALEVELYGATTNDFEVDNDLTHGDAAVSILTLGGRYVTSLSDKSSAFFALGAGVLELNADKVPAGVDDTRRGGVARFGIGLDFNIIPNLGVTFGAGFNRGFGGTDEVILFDLTTSAFFTF